MHTITTSTRWKKIKSPNDWFEHTVILNHLFSPKHKRKKIKKKIQMNRNEWMNTCQTSRATKCQSKKNKKNRWTPLWLTRKDNENKNEKTKETKKYKAVLFIEYSSQ